MSKQAKSAGEHVRSTNEAESSSFEPRALPKRLPKMTPQNSFFYFCWIFVQDSRLGVKLTRLIGHQSLKLVTNTFRLPNPSPTSM